MKLRTSFPLAAVAALLMVSVAHAGQDADTTRFSIMIPVQAAYDAYKITARHSQNMRDNIEIKLKAPNLTAERRELLTAAIAIINAEEASALGALQAESALAQLKMADWNASR